MALREKQTASHVAQLLKMQPQLTSIIQACFFTLDSFLTIWRQTSSSVAKKSGHPSTSCQTNLQTCKLPTLLPFRRRTKAPQ